MSNEALQSLEKLDKRWPGFFNMMRFFNGHEVPGFGESDLLDLQEKILKDQEGLTDLVRAFMFLMQAESYETSNPEIANWLKSNGFVDKRVINLMTEEQNIHAQLANESMSDTDRKALSEELSKVMRKRDDLSKQLSRNVGRGFAGLNDLLNGKRP